jgi:hypothetical protein
MIKEAPAVKLRQNLGEILAGIQYKGDSVVILKDGKPVAAMIDIGLFERIRAMESRFAQLTSKIQKAFSGLSDDEFEGLVDDAVKAARSARKARRGAPQ